MNFLQRRSFKVWEDPPTSTLPLQEVRLFSPDYVKVDRDTAIKDFRQRIKHYEDSYESLSLEKEGWVEIEGRRAQCITDLWCFFLLILSRSSESLHDTIALYTSVLVFCFTSFHFFYNKLRMQRLILSLGQCWKQQSVIGHCLTKFWKCSANFTLWSDMMSEHDVQTKLNTVFKIPYWITLC